MAADASGKSPDIDTAPGAVGEEKKDEAGAGKGRRATGPTTAAGKQRAAMNALRHGLLSQALLLPGESADDLDELRRGLVEQLQPVGAFETLLVDRIVSCWWRLRRVLAAEGGVFARQIANTRRNTASKERGESEQTEIQRNLNRTFHFDRTEITDPARHAAAVASEQAAEALLGDERIELADVFTVAGPAETLERVHRYEIALERSLIRASHELERVQAARKGRTVPLPVAVDHTGREHAAVVTPAAAGAAGDDDE
jgi:hypothetical protein